MQGLIPELVNAFHLGMLSFVEQRPQTQTQLFEPRAISTGGPQNIFQMRAFFSDLASSFVLIHKFVPSGASQA